MTVICPNCGNEITAPKHKKKSIKCPYCDMGGLELGLDYFDEEDNPKLSSWESFSAEHPKIAKGLKATGALAILGLAAGSVIKSSLDNLVEETPADDSQSTNLDNTSSQKDIETTEPLVEEVPDNGLYTKKNHSYECMHRKFGRESLSIP